MENKNDDFEIIDIPDNSDINSYSNQNFVEQIPNVESQNGINEEENVSFNELSPNFNTPQNNFEDVQENTNLVNEVEKIPNFGMPQDNFENINDINLANEVQPTPNFDMPQNNFENVQNDINSVDEIKATPNFDISQDHFESTQENTNFLSELPVEPNFVDENNNTQETVNGEQTDVFEEKTDNSSIELQNDKKEYVPKKEPKIEQHTKMDKSLKETIIIIAIIAVVILLLPTFYDIFTGRNPILSDLKNNISSIFEKKDKTVTNKPETKDKEETEEIEVEEPSEISFDGSKYNNQIVSYSDLISFLDQYKANIISLSSETGNKTTINVSIEIAKNIKEADHSISNPTAAFETFSSQYLNSNYNYLVTINENYKDNVILIKINNK